MIRKVLTMGLGVILMTNQFSCNYQDTGKIEKPNEVVPISVPSTTLHEVDPIYAPSPTLLEAISAGSLAEVEAILKQNTEDLNQKDPQGLTPLHIASKEGYTKIVDLLITAGADINAQDQNGETPLHKAVIDDHPVVVKQLLNAGADANIQSKLGRPIYYAVRVVGNPQMIELLRDFSIIPGRTELDPNIPVKKFEIDLNPSPPTSQQVENKTFKYRITDIPLDWELVTHQQDTFLVYKAMSLFNLPPVWSELEKQNIKNAVSLKVWKMEPEDNLESLVKDHNARLAQGRQSMEEVPCEFGKASVQLVEDRGLTYKVRYHAIFYDQFGYILEFVATPGTYDTNLPKFLDFTRKVEFLSSSGQWEKPKPIILPDEKTTEMTSEKISITTHPELYGMSGHELVIQGSELTDLEANPLEEKLQENPNDAVSRVKLLCYYALLTSEEMKSKHYEHALWIIEHCPDIAAIDMACTLSPEFDPLAYNKGKELWIKHLEEHPDNLKLLNNAIYYLWNYDYEIVEGYLKKAQIQEPQKHDWYERLGDLYSRHVPRLEGQAKVDSAQKALEQYQQALKYTPDQYDKYVMLKGLAIMSLEAGDLDLAKKYSQELLNLSAEYKSGWNYGNALHYANLTLGRIALRNDDLESAKKYLIAAGKTPGSPQLDSYGPDMTLAQELLQKNEQQVVLEYFELCRKFWESDRGRLDQWTQIVKNGQIPDFIK